MKFGEKNNTCSSRVLKWAGIVANIPQLEASCCKYSSAKFHILILI
jgi:hypothetical protein